jgi:hypothetical protein
MSYQDYGLLLPLWLVGSALVVVFVGLVTGRQEQPPSSSSSRSE